MAEIAGILTPVSDPYLAGILTKYYWVGPLTFSFAQSPNDYPLDYSGAPATDWRDTFQPVSTLQQEAVRAVLTGHSSSTLVVTATSVSSFTNLSIFEVGGGLGDIRVGQATAPLVGAYWGTQCKSPISIPPLHSQPTISKSCSGAGEQSV